MKKLILFSLIGTFLYSQNCHEPTGWCYDISTFQSFYMFSTTTINGELADWESGYDSDVIGAFCGDAMVGFVLAAEVYSTVPAMGNDGNFPGYCSQGDVPTFKVYDYSEGLTYNLQVSESVPGWDNNQIFILGNANADTTPDCNGDVGGGAFIDDCGVCSGGFTGIAPNSDKDCNGDCYGNAYINECGCVGGGTDLDYDFCYGCTDPCGSNFDPNSTIDDGSCIDAGATVYYYLYNIYNLIGYNGSADSITEAIPDQFENHILKILGEGVATQQLTPGQWVGSLEKLQYGYGYWVQISQDIENFYFE